MSEHSSSLTCNTSDDIPLETLIYEIRHLKHYTQNAPISAKQPRIDTWSTDWMVRRIWEQETEIAIRDLRKFIHPTWDKEVTKELINALNTAS